MELLQSKKKQTKKTKPNKTMCHLTAEKCFLHAIFEKHEYKKRSSPSLSWGKNTQFHYLGFCILITKKPISWATTSVMCSPPTFFFFKWYFTLRTLVMISIIQYVYTTQSQISSCHDCIMNKGSCLSTIQMYRDLFCMIWSFEIFCGILTGPVLS